MSFLRSLISASSAILTPERSPSALKFERIMSKQKLWMVPIFAELSFTSWFYCGIGFKQTVDGVLRGARDMKMFTIANFVNLGIRVTFAVTMAPRFGIAMVWTAVPIGWFVNWLISYLEYRTGKWKTIYKPSK